MATKKRAAERTTGTRQEPWLVLMHQIPPKPDYLRVKIGRRLDSIGAVALKNSVYVLPNREACLEDFQCFANEITAGRGRARLPPPAVSSGCDYARRRATFWPAPRAAVPRVSA